MPTTDIRKPVTATYVDSRGNSVTNSIGTFVSEQSSANVWKTGKRIRPLDLFAASTVLVSEVSEVRYQDGSMLSGGATISGPSSYIAGVGRRSGLHSPQVVDFTSLDARLRSRIKNASVNAVVSLAERRSTLEMVGGALKDILRTYRSLRGGNAFAAIVRGLQKPRTAKEKELANRWLEYSFGWVPLMSDIYGFAEEINKSMSEGFDYFANTSSSSRAGSSVAFRGTGYTSCIASFSDSVELRAKARFRIADASAKRLVQYGVTNPAEFLWETIPLSFVVDWFLPVGDYLSSLDSLVGISKLTVQRSYKTVRTWENSTPMGSAMQRIVSKVRLQNDSTLALPRLFDPSLPNNPFKKLSLAVALLRQSQISSGRTVPTRHS